MLYGVLSRTETDRSCGIDRDGTRQLERGDIELMSKNEADATAAKFGGVVVSDLRLFPSDYESEDEL